MKHSKNPDWFRDRGYPHVSKKACSNQPDKNASIIKLVKNESYVAKYAFYPLLHTTILERRYKRVSPDSNQRAHSYKKNGKAKKNLKQRPLHYAAHLDSIIFTYYAEILQKKYEEHLNAVSGLSECITAYRKIPVLGTEKNKGTAHFAYEVFEELNKRASHSPTVIMKFDITSFFSSIDHGRLFKSWTLLLEKEKLPPDHYNVFKAATRLHYLLLDDLRIYQNNKGRRPGFDEKRLADIRKLGVEAFFSSPQEFRTAFINKEITVYKNPFTKSVTNDSTQTKVPMGIPQGLPISAVLANLYLLEFDKSILFHLVEGKGCYYRRYSDDLIIICKPEEAEYVSSFIRSTIQDSLVEISEEKSDKFLFKVHYANKIKTRVSSIKLMKDRSVVGCPFSYLGFEFYGYQTLIKSTNLAKFYRRMIYAVKKKAKRSIKLSQLIPSERPVLYRNQLYRLYMSQNLSQQKVYSNWKRLEPNKFGVHVYKTKPKVKPLRSNYLSYVKRTSRIMQAPEIQKQIRKRQFIFNQAVHRHLNLRKNL